MEEDPKLYHAIMVSSTFTDLEAHRREVIDAIHRFGFHANVMEYNGADADADVIEASLRFVRHSAAYVALIGHKYGQTPHDPTRNADQLSITELEFNEARRLGRPILLFLMSDDHAVTMANIERDPGKQVKLAAFREQAKRRDSVSEAMRIYESFASKEDLAKKSAVAIGRLAQLLPKPEPIPAGANGDATDEKLEAILAAVGKLSIPDRAVREAIARLINIQPEATEAEMVQSVERFETDYRALQAQLAAITLVDNRVMALKADAEAALAAGDLDKALAAYRHASDAARERATEPVRTTAQLIAAEAGAHLLALDWAAADKAWAEAAAMLMPFDREAAEDIGEDAADRLQTHGEVHALTGAIATAILRIRALAEAAHIRGNERNAARLRNNLGVALHTQGARTGGSEGLRLLDEAVAAYREAIAVYVRDGNLADWAMTQNNLANVLQIQGERAGADDGLNLLNQAVTAYREALTLYADDSMSADWAMIQNNLGNALYAHGERATGAEGTRLLEEAITAYREALTVRTRNDTPADWATTQNNLGNALGSLGVRIGGSDGLCLLDDAISAYRGALTVRTLSEIPVEWARTQENLGLTYESMTTMSSGQARQLLVDAGAAFVAALTIYTSEHMPYDYGTATRSLARVREKLAALDS